MANKDRAQGAAKEAKGTVKQAAAKVLRDRELHEEGRADKAEGQIQGAWGKAKDAVRSIFKR